MVLPEAVSAHGSGQLLHAALLQFYHEYLPADQLVSVGNAAKEIGIAGRRCMNGWRVDEPSGSLRPNMM
ncbi:hypothetical protein KSX_96540 [Ktedonospora formicarum]|uniref:Uncharacterized protein n=1 Tax=Ktedonospora formicarum TaxID=2778364 RepID=A0A8J3MZ09_9CHLR|nr:hypothetical protein KSX_96540 [Ktedonospora formicarum]